MQLNKNDALHNLAIKRKQTTPPVGSFPLGFYADVYECDFVSPYTKGACNVDADIFLLLQDWSSDDEMKRSSIDPDVLHYGRTLSLPTNRNLEQLLYDYFDGLKISDTYGTNLYPFIKSGGMSAYIPQQDLVMAAEQFALPQIRIVGPKLVICFGKSTFNAVRKVLGERLVDSVDEGIKSPFSIDHTHFWLQSHPGRLGKINRNKGGVDRVSEDWDHMSEQFKKYSVV